EVLEVPAIPRIARQVAAAGELDVESPDPRLAADGGAARPHELGVEAGAQGNQGRESRGARVIRTVAGIGDPHAGVRALYRRDAEPRHAGRVSRAHVREVRGEARVAASHGAAGDVAHDADDEREALV